jgi:hypothetical protein
LITGGLITATGSINSTANVTGGNINTAGLMSAGGNVIGGNVSTGGLITATGNITGGNIITAGLAQGLTLSATGNVIGGNVTTGGLISATGNIAGGNVTTGGLISATGNITGGNVSTGGLITATGDIATGGQLISTQGGNLVTGEGQLYLNGANNNRIDFNTNGTAAPSFTTRSVGTKVALYPALGESAVDYAIGVDAATLWQSIPGNDAGQFFKWYGGTTLVASLSGTGVMSVIGNVTGANINAAGLSLTGNVLSVLNSTSNINTTGNITANNITGTTSISINGQALATVDDATALAIALG